MPFLDRTHTDLLMTAQDNKNDNDTVKMTEKPPEEVLEEPIGSEAHIIEPLGELEGEKTTRIQEPKSGRENARKSEVAKKKPARIESDAKPIPKLESELRKYSDASKKTDLTIRDIQRQIKDLNKKTDTRHHQIVRDLQAQVREMQRKIDKIDKSIKSSNKTRPKKEKLGNKKSKKKSSQNKSRKR